MLDHEKLDVYQCAIEFLALSVHVIETNVPTISMTEHEHDSRTRFTCLTGKAY